MKDKQLLSWNGNSIYMTCRICQREGQFKHTVTANTQIPDLPSVTFYKCSHCQALNAVADVFIDYEVSSNCHTIPSWVRHYAQVGAGIDSMIRPLQRTAPRINTTMLDVGCGIGYTVDFWNYAYGRAYGVEPSGYSDYSKSLNIEIYDAYVGEVEQLQNEKFDRVLSAEVIEHVDDINEFVKILKLLLDHKGILIVTTPNSDFISQENSIPAIYAALSPGFHRVLFSTTSLELTLQRSGFKYVKSYSTQEQIVSFASSEEFDLSRNLEEERSQYISYLRASLTKGNNDIRMGFLFRFMKECVNLSNYVDAHAAWDDLKVLVQEKFELDLCDYKSIIGRTEKVNKFDDYVKLYPFFLPAALYYASMATLNGEALVPDAAHGFLIAAETAHKQFTIAPGYSQESASIYWLALLHSAVADIYSGNHESAQMKLQKIIDSVNQENVGDDLQPSQDVISRSMRELAVSLLQSGEPELSMRQFRLCINKCESKSFKEDTYQIWGTALQQASQLYTMAGSLLADE